VAASVIFGLLVLVGVVGVALARAKFSTPDEAKEDRRRRTTTSDPVLTTMSTASRNLRFLGRSDADMVTDVAMDARDQPSQAYVTDLDRLDPHYREPDQP